MQRTQRAKKRTLEEPQRLRIGAAQAVNLVGQYTRKRLLEQVRSVAFISVFLVVVQSLVLGIPLRDAAGIVLGLVGVTLGLAFFMEGLLLGIMPLGETCGHSLPGRVPLPGALLFALLLGVAATYAEPALFALQSAGAGVLPWSAPLLYLLLNTRSDLLLAVIALGVGLAVLLSMLRFLRQWSLKPILLLTVPLALALSLYAYFQPNLRLITALAWDTGGVTTGPVTVPLVIALGLGISRMSGSEEKGLSGLGIVTLASLVPILTVLGLGAVLAPRLPAPLPREEFFQAQRRQQVARLFRGEDGLKAYALSHASEQEVRGLFAEDREGLRDFLARAAQRGELVERIGGREAFLQVLERLLSPEEREGIELPAAREPRPGLQLLRGKGLAAVQAILPLSLFLVLVITVVLRQRPRRTDELALGILFSLVGMFLFSLGAESGLSRLGRQTGYNMPVAFTTIEYPEEARVIRPFDPEGLLRSVDLEGGERRYFYLETRRGLRRVEFDPERYDPGTGAYMYIPEKGPLLGQGRWAAGLVLALLLAFLMGYGATLAEPALNSLGFKLEELTVGTFKRSFLVKTVAVGVGLGLAAGFARLIWSVPLAPLLVPLYLALLVLSLFSTEEFAGIAWDSGGVTTGPVTVPMVIALGSGIGGRVGAAESFGICALASAFPILSVLCAGLFLSHQRRRRLSAR